MGAHRKEQGGSSILSASFSGVEVSFDARKNGLSFGLKSLSDDREQKEQANLCLREQEMGAEQLTNKMCKSSRIPDSLSCCFNFPRNVEMDVLELGSLLSVLKAALS